MTWLALVFALELGALPSGGFLMYDPPAYQDWTGSGYTELSASVELAKTLYAGGGVRTTVLSDGSLNFWPEGAYYYFTAGVRWKGIEIFWRHYCIHPVVPYLPLTGDVRQVWEGSYDEIGIRISGTLPLLKGRSR